MKYIGCPLLGDFLYGQKSELINRQALHSFKVQFIHPIFKKDVLFTANMPEDMESILSL